MNLSKINSFGIGFGLGPRINAAGRMDTASLAIDIFSAGALSDKLREDAKKLCVLNDRRRKEVEDIGREAEEMIRDGKYARQSAIVLANGSWNAGVIGIAAAKIAEKYTRPCILFGGNGESLIGSARSIEGINIFEALSRFAERFEKFGGHAQAAGLTINPSVLEGLRRDLCSYIDENYDESVFEPKKTYDIEFKTGDITKKLVEDISRLEPFGPCNERPCIAILDAQIGDIRYFGNGKKQHAGFALLQGGCKAEAVSFYFKESHSFSSRRCDALCEAEMDDYSGYPRLIIRDMAMKYDAALAEGYLMANRDKMMRNFINEVSSAGEGMKAEGMSESDFVRRLESELSLSRFGLCIAAGTVPAFRRIINTGDIAESLRHGALSLFDEKAYSAENCIACGVPTGFERIMRIGLPTDEDGGVLFNESLLESYRQYAKDFFAPREELLGFFRFIGAGEPMTAEDINKKAAPEKAMFMLKVLDELKLIETDKSGRIHAIKNAPRKELGQSACFRGFENLLQGIQKA